MNNASAQQKIFPLVPEHAASDMSAVLHMIPAEKAGVLPPLGVKLPDDVAASFRGTPFADLYEEALNLLRSRNITADERAHAAARQADDRRSRSGEPVLHSSGSSFRR